MGYHLHLNLHTDGVLKALRMALKQRKTDRALVHHSDRGLQYCAEAYQRAHRQHSLTCSMTDGYDCYQNPLAERLNGILKAELLTAMPHDLEQTALMIRQAVQIYNHDRPHLALKYKTPDCCASGVNRIGLTTGNEKGRCPSTYPRTRQCPPRGLLHC
jgi:putative transposase